MKEVVSFKNRSLKIIGDLYKPHQFKQKVKYPAIVIVHPVIGVKEQTAGLYAKSLAQNGFITLAYDATYNGESEGEPRYLEDPSAKISDIIAAVDFLSLLEFVDEKRIGVLGICAGGGYSVRGAMIEKRIKAITLISPVNLGRLHRQGDFIKTLESIGDRRTKQLKEKQYQYINYVPDCIEFLKQKNQQDNDIWEATQYYRTPRGQHPRSFNKRLAISEGLLLSFDAFHLADKLLTQPLEVIVAQKIGSFGSYRDGKQIFDLAASKKNFHIVKAASHVDLYDKPEPVKDAIQTMVIFYKQNL